MEKTNLAIEKISFYEHMTNKKFQKIREEYEKQANIHQEEIDQVIQNNNSRHDILFNQKE